MRGAHSVDADGLTTTIQSSIFFQGPRASLRCRFAIFSRDLLCQSTFHVPAKIREEGRMHGCEVGYHDMEDFRKTCCR